MSEVISAQEALQFFSINTDFSLIDVRSEGEFELGHMPNASNVPILNNEHRHLVGLSYKKEGQERAISLGNELVNPIKNTLIARWRECAKNKTYVYCWRGGLRSKISCEWMNAEGLNPIRIEGGYKAMRGILLDHLVRYPDFLVLAGMTGSGKTQILENLDLALDLEDLAKHRGSAFGNLPLTPQPKQQNFENALGLYFFKAPTKVIIEDESRNIGAIKLPNQMFDHMATSPSVIVEESVDFRAKNIFESYILDLHNKGQETAFIHEFYKNCLNKIERKLGGLEHANIMNHLDQAFAKGVSDPELHWLWIGQLLEKYYDKMYLYSLGRKKRNIVFRGDHKATRQFLEHYQRGTK